MNQYTYHTTVLNADGDFRRMLKPSALFRYVEQAAADHARAYDMDDAFFAARHTAFLVGKQAVEIYRMPTRGEKVTLDTACEPCKKGSMKRITHLRDEAGRELAMVDCRWKCSAKGLCASPPSNTTARSPWGPRWQCPMPRRRMAGMWWAAARSTWHLNAIWSLPTKRHKRSEKELQKIYNFLCKNSCKMVSKELQYSYRKR